MNSEKLVLSTVDYIIIAATLAISAAIGLFFQLTKKTSTNKEYIFAGKNMPIFPVAFSLMATFMSATTLVGIPAEMYLYGTNMAFMNIGFLLGPVITSYLFLPIYFANNVSTSYEYLEMRFGKITRKLISGIYAFQLVMFTSATLYAPALALSAVTNLSMWISVVTIGIVCTFYCTLGGMKAVLWTDVFQSILMFCCLFTVIIKGCLLLGGIGHIFSTAYEGGRLIFPRFTFDLEAHYSMFTVFALGMIVTMSEYGASQIQVQRLLTVKNLSRSRIAAFLSIPMLMIFHLLCCLCGLILYAYFKNCDPITSPNELVKSVDQLLPYFIANTLIDFPGLPGLCICGIFSASLSTVSSAINSLATVVSQDFLQPHFPSLTKSVFHIKVISLILGALCISLSFLIASIGSLIKINVVITGLVAGPNLAVYLLATCSKVANEKGVILGIFVSVILGAFLTFGPENVTHPYLSLSNECPSSQSAEYLTTFSTTQSPTTSNYFNSSLESSNEPSIEEKSFHLSYMWIAVFGMITCWIVGYFGSLIISCFQEKSEVPEIYLSPVRTWFSKKFSKSGKTEGVTDKKSIEISVINSPSKVQYETNM